MSFKESLRKTFFPTVEELKEENKALKEKEKSAKLKARISNHEATIRKNKPKDEANLF